MSSRPGRRRLDPDPEPPLRGNRRRPLVPKPPPPRGDRRRPRGPEPLPSGDLRRSRPQCAPQLQHRPDDAGDGVDLISGLPNDLLREVLARLGCARAAAQTSTLSRRWLDLWRHIQHRYLYFRGVTPSKLLDILGQVPSSDLALLHISVPPNRTCEHACVASLLRTAASLRPVEFFFSAEVDCISVELPNFHQAEAISLELESGIHGYQLDTAGDFPVLERLFVSGCYFNFTDLISRCPRLRVLRVSTSGYRTYSDSITVHSTTLRELNVGGSGLRSGIVIKAPVLERLSLSNCFFIFLPFEFPCLRSLCLHHLVGSPIVLQIRSTMIEEIVLDQVDIMVNIDINSPTLKILTLQNAYFKSPIRIVVVAPVLKMFTLRSMTALHVKVLLSAPALENLSWDCTSRGLWMWFLNKLNLWMEEGVYILSLCIILQHSGPDPPNIHEMFGLPNVSILKLMLYTNKHAYGTAVSQILGICSEIQRLHLIIMRDPIGRYDGICRPKCNYCGQLERWRDQNISLTALEAVEIENFGGMWCGVDLLKLLFRCAPLMKQVTLKACPYMLPSIRVCKEIRDLFKAHPSVKCDVYDSCGKKVVYERSAFASSCN